MTPNDLGQFSPYLQEAQHYLKQYGYWAVFWGVLLEDFGVPVPGETLLIASALLAAVGSMKQFNIIWLLLLGFCGAVLGDNIGFAIGHFGGRRWAVRYGRYVWLNQERLARLEGLFVRHGGKIIVIARFLEGLRQFNGFIAGTLQMQWTRFLFFNAVGAALWVAFWGGTSYYLGGNLAVLFRHFKSFEPYLLIGVALLGAAYFFYRVTAERRKKR